MSFLRENWLIIFIVLCVIFLVAWIVKYAIKIFTGPGTPEIESINQEERDKIDKDIKNAEKVKDALNEEHKEIIDRLDSGEVHPSEIFDKELKK